MVKNGQRPEVLPANPHARSLKATNADGRPRARRKDYGSIVAPATYVKARRLPGRTLRVWLEEVAKSAQGGIVRTVLDLGCGTGRFSSPLARRFRATVIAVDPSAEMLAEARKEAPESVAFLRGSAERIPLKNGQADMVFMSQTWHHLRDAARAARETRRVLSPDGLLCIRNSTIENLGSYLYLRFFPGARQSCLRRLPRRKEIVAAVTRAGFRLVKQRAVRQEFAPTPRAYLGKIKQKATFDLAGLSDEEFALGFARLARHCRTRDQHRAVFEQIDFFTFRESRGATGRGTMAKVEPPRSVDAGRRWPRRCQAH